MLRKPIKRDKNISILSRDHHAGLLFCWKIRQGIKKNVELGILKKYVSYFWDHHLQKHFSEEEVHLFLKFEDEKCTKALKQHQEIILLFRHIMDNELIISYDLLTELADLLYAHIRFEERVLFPHLEKLLDEDELSKIGALLEHSHKIPFKDNFSDEFWA